MRHTKIVCTIGPASETVDILKALLVAGMNVARLNLSHGSHADHKRRVAAIKEAAAKVNKNIGILFDLAGPKIRLGKLQEPIHLKAGDTLTLTTERITGNRERIPVNYPELPQDVKHGDTILLGDGLVSLKVLDTGPDRVLCRVENDGEVSSGKGVNLPGVRTSLPSLTEKDVDDLHFAVEQGADFIAASFIRKAQDVLAVRKILEDVGAADIPIIAKIETWEAVDKFEEIVKVADGIMVARGDLGLEVGAEEVPLIQKRIIARCNRLGKPVITATQMLESMINNPRPTRAEASDVANAIMDGTDAVMLSAETAVGRYPVEAVKTMARIARRTEEELPYAEFIRQRKEFSRHTVTDAISYATCATATDLEAAAVLTSTETGYTARMVAKYRPRCPIIAVTPHARVLQRLTLVWGVEPLLVRRISNTDEMIETSIGAALAAGFIKGGDLVVITAGVPVGVHGTTNLLKVHTVGDILARGVGIGSRAVTGTVRVARTAREAIAKVTPGDILVTTATDRDFLPALEKVAAVVTETGGLTSHAAIVGLEYGIPVIVGVEGATAILPDGEKITVDPQRGLIYAGVARVL
ncbi:MAG: Pyruvate kinase [Clostridia bacterium 62_21]|nr:MAG: Pyruvate kinase [Clostridia bacterium 62_21]